MTDFVCEVDGRYRSACKGLGYYSEHEGKRFCVLHFPGEVKTDAFGKAVKGKLDRKNYDFGGTVFPEGTSSFMGTVFEADTIFAGATFVGPADFSGAKFGGERTNFTMTIFNGEETSFANATFDGEVTLFEGTRFNGKRTSFANATFNGIVTHFDYATFDGDAAFYYVTFNSSPVFRSATFGGKDTSFTEASFNRKAYFREATFDGGKSDFDDATFARDANFDAARFFGEIHFIKTTFGARVAFAGSKENKVFGPGTWVAFAYCRIDKPELFSFGNVMLHPGWFLLVDMSKVDFTDVEWYGMPGGPEGTLEEEIRALKKRNIKSPHALLAQACRRLSAIAEENREFPLANEFHYWSMDTFRRESWDPLIWIRKHWLRVERRCGPVATLRWASRVISRRRLSHPRIRFGLIYTFYWALSGYGVRAGRAFLVLIALCAVFAVLYMVLGPDALRVSTASNFGQGLEHGGHAVVYSLSTMARLNPEPTPDPGLFQFLVTIEGILGPLQIALLALAIRRKVMR